MAVDRGVRAWRVLDDLVLEVYRATRRFPTDDREVLAPALRRTTVAAAVRLTSGEGPGGAPGEESVDRALALLAEVRYYLYLARRLRLIDALAYRGITARHDRCLRALEQLRPETAGPASTPFVRGEEGAPAGG